MKSRRVLGFILIILIWLALMAGAGYLSYEHMLPVRIENWKPEPAS
jgi:hypothetical protein